MGKITWGPCGSGELVTCGNHAYAMWRADGADHERKSVRNLVNAMRWPLLSEGTGLTHRLKSSSGISAWERPLRPPSGGTLCTIGEASASPAQAVPGAPCHVIPAGVASHGDMGAPVTAHMTPAVRLMPTSAPLSVAMLRSPVGAMEGVQGASEAPPFLPSSSRMHDSQACLRTPGSGLVAAANGTPALRDTTPLGAANVVSTAVATDSTDERGHVAAHADKPSQHGLENMFMGLSSPGRIERPARCDTFACQQQRV